MAGLWILLLGLAVVAAMMAFLVTYEEMSHHFRDRRRVLAEAARTGVVALGFFACLIAVVLIVLARFA